MKISLSINETIFGACNESWNYYILNEIFLALDLLPLDLRATHFELRESGKEDFHIWRIIIKESFINLWKQNRILKRKSTCFSPNNFVFVRNTPRLNVKYFDSVIRACWLQLIYNDTFFRRNGLREQFCDVTLTVYHFLLISMRVPEQS